MRGILVIAWILIGSLGDSARAAVEHVAFHENVMGTSLELRVRADSDEAARRAEIAALRTIDRLSAIFSNHDASSEFRRWQAGPRMPVKVSADLFEVLGRADVWRERTGGAFDPRAQVFSRLWAEAERRNVAPSAIELEEARTRLQGPAWRLDERSMTAERLTDAPLTLDAIAKGAIVEKAAEAALKSDSLVRGVMLNVGGDLRAAGEWPQEVAIVSPFADTEGSDPLARFSVANRAVATSGSSQRFFTIQGRRYSHVIDPRTGQPASAAAAATVIAGHSADADALATALNVLGPEKGVALANRLPGVACLIVTAGGKILQSAAWPKSADTEPRPDAPARAAADDAVGSTHELIVNFEINQPENGRGRYRRPYVAVWVEDKDGLMVRTLLLWVSQGGAGPFQWVPDMKRWHAADRVRKRTDKREMILVMSRPTRPPGKYSVAWDGKDDLGRPVAPGEYTICVDAAREHGTYQNMKKTVVLGGEPFSVEMPGGGGIELKSATIVYRRK